MITLSKETAQNLLELVKSELNQRSSYDATNTHYVQGRRMELTRYRYELEDAIAGRK